MPDDVQELGYMSIKKSVERIFRSGPERAFHSTAKGRSWRDRRYKGYGRDPYGGGRSGGIFPFGPFSFSGMDLFPREEIFVVNPNPEGKLYFSQEEIKKLFVSWLVLVLAFMGMLSPTNVGIGVFFLPSSYIISLFLVAGFASATGFVGHELGHKFTAQHYGNHSEYQWYPIGLIMALLLGMFSPFIFLAPGVTMSYGYLTREQRGLMSAAGVIVNIVNAVIFTALAVLSGGIWKGVFSTTAYLNLLFAFFNLLPIPPLDGSKIMTDFGTERYVMLWTAVVVIFIARSSLGI